MNGRVGWEARPLNDCAMHIGAQSLLGTHNFSAFRAAGCQARSPVRTMHQVSVVRRGDLVVIDVVANAFLQHMVRNLVGSLVQVGLGRYPPNWITQLLDSRDRTQGGLTMSPWGLYLMAVEYPGTVQPT